MTAKTERSGTGRRKFNPTECKVKMGHSDTRPGFDCHPAERQVQKSSYERDYGLGAVPSATSKLL